MDVIYINDLLGEYPNKTILEINNMLLKNGVDNKRIKIKVPCKVCGKEVVTTPGTYKKQKTFACKEHIKHKPNGKNSMFYNRMVVNCSYCGKEIEVIPAKANKTNKFGDSHNFCSQECYWKFRSMYYCGEKSAMYQHEYTDEQRNNLSKGVVKRLQKTDRTNTKIQLAINKVLDELNISYKREFALDFYSCDNFLSDYNLIIEVMGDYWHGNPLKYNANKYCLNAIQSKTILKDKQKRGYIKKHYGYSVLNLWEIDIEQQLDKCKEIIKLYVRNKGILKDYNSFNYSFKNNILTLNQNMITPYQDMHSSEYAYLIQKTS